MSHTKAILNRLCEHLAKRAEPTARFAYGHACEQWIRSEAFAAMNER